MEFNYEKRKWYPVWKGAAARVILHCVQQHAWCVAMQAHGCPMWALRTVPCCTSSLRNNNLMSTVTASRTERNQKLKSWKKPDPLTSPPTLRAAARRVQAAGPIWPMRTTTQMTQVAFCSSASGPWGTYLPFSWLPKEVGLNKDSKNVCYSSVPGVL